MLQRGFGALFFQANHFFRQFVHAGVFPFQVLHLGIVAVLGKAFGINPLSQGAFARAGEFDFPYPARAQQEGAKAEPPGLMFDLGQSKLAFVHRFYSTGAGQHWRENNAVRQSQKIGKHGGKLYRQGEAYSRLAFFLISMLRRLIFWLRVDRGTRKRSAASVWFQLHLSSMSMMMCRSQSSMMSNSEASPRCSRMGNAVPLPAIASGNNSGVISIPEESTTARSMTFSSSRTLPGHEYVSKGRMASGVMRRSGFSFSSENFCRKWSTRAGMSSLRCRRGGRSMVITFSR